jgi:hypothetical protein
MGILEAVLAFVGLTTLISRVIRWYLQPLAVPPEEDVAAPYREGLHAAVRMQRAAQDLEAQLYAEAARHASSPSSLPANHAEWLGDDQQ